jgi:hypothetical protein
VTKLEGFAKELDELFVTRDKEYEAMLGLPLAASTPNAAGRGQDGAETPDGNSGPFSSAGFGMAPALY